jgi:hypothetical protein
LNGHVLSEDERRVIESWDLYESPCEIGKALRNLNVTIRYWQEEAATHDQYAALLQQQFDDRDKTIEQLQKEVELLRKLEDAAWKAIETQPFGVNDIYHAHIGAINQLEAALDAVQIARDEFTNGNGEGD